MTAKKDDIPEKENINNYIYNITFQNNTIGIGIFCQIFDEIHGKEIALVLITKNNIQILDNKIEINMKEEKINLKTKEYFNKNGITIIEIDEKQEEKHLKDISFIRINYSGSNISKNNEFNDKQVYLLDLNTDNKKIDNVGIIQDINFENYKIDFLCFKKGKISGGLIIYLDNSKTQLIGVYSSADDQKYWKEGIFISEYLQDIYEKYLFTEININKIEIDNKNKNSKKNNDMNNQNIKNYNNSKNQLNKNININNINIQNNNNMNNQYNQNMNNNNINNQNQQNLFINNNINYQNNQNINNKSYQNNQNLNNNNNINYQQNQNIINENFNKQITNNDYNINNQQINNNNMNGQNMINNNSMNYQNIQNINNNMNNQNINNMNYQNNQNINNNMNNQNINNNINCQNMNNNMNNQNINNIMNNQKINNNINFQCNNLLNNQYNNNMNICNNNQNINNMNNRSNNYSNNCNINNQYNNNNQNMIIQRSNEMKNLNLNNNMNINNHNQFQNNINSNQQNSNQMNNNLVYNCGDIYPYINENKINISFINKDNAIRNVTIPSLLRNSELYYTADKINNLNFFEYSDVNSIKLYLNNQLIQNNDEPINKIVFNGSQIFIEETIEDLSYYDSLIQNSQNINKASIHFKDINEKRIINIFFPNNISIKDMLHGFYAKNKIPIFNRKYFSFIFNIGRLDLNDDTSLIQKSIINGSSINFVAQDIIQDSNNMKYSKKDFPGKKLNISLINNKDELIGEIYAGSLQQIKAFYEKLKKYLSNKNIDLTGKSVIILSGTETIINELDERTFSSFGILNDFKCKIDGDKNILFLINDIMKNK